jgi:hypothetical protein
LLDSELATGTKNGYRFTYVPGEPDRMNGWIRAYTVRADPVQPGETGNYHYFTDQSGIIRVDSQQEANADSPPVTDPKSAWRDEEMCAAGSEPGGSIVPNSEQVAKPTDLLLQVTATERLWVAVDADGKTVLQKVLSPNEVEKPEGARLL